MMNYDTLTSPLALLPAHTAVLLEAFRRIEAAPPGSPALMDVRDIISSDTWKPYDVVNGAAIVGVRGVLVHERCYWWDETSYAEIAGAVALAMADEEVRGVALHVNSPGGVVSGCFDLADALYGLRGEKPMWSIVDESAYSAAYAIASSTDRILVPRTGGVGSVGVITMHVDITKMLDNAGIKVNTIQFGARKSDSYPTTPLSDEARQNMQAEVDTLGQMFVSMVARNRGIDESVVRETEAGCFLGEAGVDVGFADAVMPAEQALMEFIDHIN